MSEPLGIEIKNVHKSFRNGRDHILKGVSLSIPAGKLTYILGPSGTGKSVLIKHILGLLKPDSGEIHINGKNITLLNGRALSEHRTIFGMLFQNAALFDDMTVFENVAFPLVEHTSLSGKEIRDRVHTTLKKLKMMDGYDKLPNELSGGMKKRVGLARAIIREPSILLYDEPTTGLDPVTRNTVDELIATLKSDLDLTSVVISHDILSALSLADKIAFLFKGDLVFFGTPEEFRNCDHPTVRTFLEAEINASKALLGS